MITARSKWCEKTLLERPEVDVKDLDTFSLTMFRCSIMRVDTGLGNDPIFFRLQLKVLALFHVPVLGPMLRLVANKLMRLNIFLATDWEQWIIQVRCNVCLLSTLSYNTLASL